MHHVHFLHNCVHIMMTRRHMLTAAPCSKLTTKNRHTLVRLHCRCTSHGIALNASRNLDGGGAWSQTTASGNVPCLSRSRGVVLVIKMHGVFAGTVDGSCGEDHRVDAGTRDGGSRELSDTNSTASLVAVCDRHEFAQSASCVRRRQNEVGRLGVHVQSVCKCSRHTRRVRQNR